VIEHGFNGFDTDRACVFIAKFMFSENLGKLIRFELWNTDLMDLTRIEFVFLSLN
jgi:hypothetical protein